MGHSRLYIVARPPPSQEAKEAPELINMYGTGIALYAQLLKWTAHAALRRRDLVYAQVPFLHCAFTSCTKYFA